MRMCKKALALIISAVIVLSAFIVTPVTFGADAASLIKGTFTIDTPDNYDPGELRYYYRDSYFKKSGTNLDPHLRTMSAALEFTVQGISDMPDETYGRILRNIGFLNIETYDMDHTGMDTLGVVLAHKSVDGKDVVAVALRGDRYEIEMAANLIAGAQGDIQAFADAEALVENRVRAYLEKYNITQAKYWVVGYSRSGAVANLFGRALNRDLSGFCTAVDDIYVYTFESALGCADNTAYANIHNIIDLNDMITYLYPALWSMYGCGVPDYIGDADETITLKAFSLISESYSQDLGEVRTADFISDFMSFLANNLSRETYYEKLQIPASQVAEIYFSLSEEQRLVFIEYFEQVFGELADDNKLISTLVVALAAPNSKLSAQMVTNLITKHMDQVAETYGKPVSDDEYDTIKAAVSPVVSVLLPIAGKDFKATYKFDDSARSTSAPLYHVMTLAGNLDSLITHHYNYNVFNKLTALDSYYQERDDVILGDVDGDGKVTVIDATVIQQKLAGIDAAVYVEMAADTDDDGQVTILDATYIQRWLAKVIFDDRIGKLAA
ncbi:MAG: dockerin type I repeat-containing protein [Ruminococcus sp.]|nr:dockerin type I repeat-containing protein [Ruminococcus sp.]